MSPSSAAFRVSFRRAVAGYAMATLVLATGMMLAAARIPGAYDWRYHVISALAARKHNPEGAAWFAGALALAMLLLGPVVAWLTRESTIARAVRLALWIGMVCGVFVGVERLAFYHFSDLVRKG